ncbi:hypothetical protein NHJ6243_010110 [Beauveria neobassiana]
MPSRPVTPASPRNARVKSPTPASPMFGCGMLEIRTSDVPWLTLIDVDSRNGALYCQICDDLVWDPTLEELRLRKIGTGSFSGKNPSLLRFQSV